MARTPDNWRLNAAPAQKAFAAVAHAISQFEPLTVGVLPHLLGQAQAQLPVGVRVLEMDYNDSWVRDCGPTFVSNGRDMRAVDWIFNAWGGLEGGLYSPWDKDDQVAQRVAEIEGVDRYRAPLVLEGGSIHVDGQGTLLTTRECLLNPNRNPELSQAQIEGHLREYLGVDQFIWLNRGIYNDETSGHVDNIACFIRPGEVALAWTDDRSDPQYEISAENYDILCSAVDARGRRLKVHKLPLPRPVTITREESEGVLPVEGTYPRKPGDRLAASYANFVFCNGGAVVPTFGDPADEKALTLLQELLPERKVVGVYAREILLGGGNIHCITQQVPRVEIRD